MKQIKGLLLKDILELKTYKKNFFISLIIYSLIILTNVNSDGGASIGTLMIMFLFSVYATATFNYDERSNSDRYILTLNVSRKNVVISKYILCISSILIGALIGIVLSSIIFYISLSKLPDFIELFSTLIGGLVALSFMQSIQIPCIYKYGAEKGRLQIYIVMMIITVLLVIIINFTSNANLDFLNNISYLIPIIGLFLVIINYYISYLISCKIYLKKEI